MKSQGCGCLTKTGVMARPVDMPLGREAISRGPILDEMLQAMAAERENQSLLVMLCTL